MTAVVDVPAGVGAFLDELVSVLRETTELEAAYLIGSAAIGAYEPGRSDLDVYAVVAEPLSDEAKRTLRALKSPARQLELVVYTREQAAAENPRYELNTGDPEDSDFWFVLDRSSAEQHAVALHGPPWPEIFAPVPRERVLRAIAESLEWQERNDPSGAGSVLNTMRLLHWLETGQWASKPAVAAWLREHVRETLERKR